MLMKLLFSTPSCITVGDNIDYLKLDAFKVLTSTYDITIFITTESIKSVLGVDVEPQGSIRNADVVDVQVFVNALEQARADIFNILADNLDHELPVADSLGFTNYELVKRYMPRLSKADQLRVLKLTSCSMDESVWLETKYVNWLKRVLDLF